MSLKDNEAEEERFNAYIEACSIKHMKKKIMELALKIPG